MMNRSVLSAAVSAACLTMAGPAAALALNTYVAGAPDTIEIRYSGASAQDVALEKAMAAVCSSGTLNGASQLNNGVYFCTIAPNTAPNPGVSTILTFTSLPASVNKMVVYKSSLGGSGNGTTPVANGTNLTFVNLAFLAATPACLGAAVTITSSALPSYTMQPIVQVASCNTVGSGLQLAVSDVGLSDVEPSLLGTPAGNIAKLDRFEGAHLAFGIPVTLTMRNALQTAQSLTSGSEVPDQQPELSSHVLTAMMNGSMGNFSQIGGPSQVVHMALRSATSGTTRANNAYFATDGGQCHLGVSARKASTTTSTASTVCSTLTGAGAAGGEVLYGSGSDNVLTCLANHQAAGRWAFGILSMETSTTTSGGTTTIPSSSDAIRFIKVDGDLPTLLNVANGKYGLWASVSYQYRNAASGNAIPADRKDVADTVKAYLGNKEVLTDVNGTIAQTWAAGGAGGTGETGYLAAPSAINAPPALPVTAVTLAANPTNPFTKVSGGVQNNCHRGLKF